MARRSTVRSLATLLTLYARNASAIDGPPKRTNRPMSAMTIRSSGSEYPWALPARFVFRHSRFMGKSPGPPDEQAMCHGLLPPTVEGDLVKGRELRQELRAAPRLRNRAPSRCCYRT